MADDDASRLLDMLIAARRATELANRGSRDDFFADDERQLAVVHLIQIVGEAARGVSDEMRDAHPEIPWSEITGMRHRIVHDYFNVDIEIVWDTIDGDLAPLIVQLEAIVVR